MGAVCACPWKQPVAQNFILLYRGFSIRRIPNRHRPQEFLNHLPSATRRYGRLKSCATFRALRIADGAGHVLAFLGAAFAGFGAFAARLCLVIAAFIGAGAADIGTEIAKTGGKFRVGVHERDGGAADQGALAVEVDTTGHGFGVGFFGALFAGDDGGITGVDTGLILLVHNSGF